MIFKHAEPVKHHEIGDYFEKPAQTGYICGIVGDGSHTHVGPDFISIRDQETNQQIRWNVPMTDSQKDFYGTGDNSSKY